MMKFMSTRLAPCGLSSNFWPEITSTNAADHLHAGHARGRSRGWLGRNQFGNRETFFVMHGSERHWSARQRASRSKVSRSFDKTVRSHHNTAKGLPIVRTNIVLVARSSLATVPCLFTPSWHALCALSYKAYQGQ